VDNVINRSFVAFAAPLALGLAVAATPLAPVWKIIIETVAIAALLLMLRVRKEALAAGLMLLAAVDLNFLGASRSLSIALVLSAVVLAVLEAKGRLQS
jgi:hypothetical protein